MKKLALVFILITILSSAFAVPTFASDNCDPTQDYLALGREQFDNANFEAALIHVNCGLSLEPTSYELYMLRAMIYCNTERIELAIADMTVAIGLRPDSAFAYNNRGWANYRLGNLEEAMSNLNKAIELNEELAYAYNNRGLVYHTMGEHTLAYADYQMAIDYGMTEAWAEINLHNLEFEMSKMEGLVHDEENCG